ALWLLATYAGLTAMGITAVLLPAVPPEHGLQDWFYVAGNGAGVAAAALLIRNQVPGRDREYLLDGAIISSGFALLASIYLIKPAFLAAGSLTLAVLATAQPVTDLFVLALLVSLALRGSLRNPALRLIAIGELAILIVDCILAFVPGIFENPVALKA